MLHRRALVYAVVTALLALAVGAPVRAASPAAPPRAGDTGLVYMNGSARGSAGGAAAEDLQEMLAVGSGARVNVVVETLGTAQWSLPEISSERNQRFVVEHEALQLVDDTVGHRDLADPDTLRDFIIWAMGRYPAERYMLVFWDHGGGSVAGFGADELAQDPAQSSLRLAGIQQGLADAVKVTGAKFEAVGFDTCLLGSVEMAALLAPYSRYLIASEELEPGHGWNYTPFLQALVDDPAITGDRLGKVIADAFVAQALEWEDRDEITLSVTDLTRIGPVITALEAFVAVAGPDLQAPDRLKALARARSRAEDYGNDGETGSDMVDLGDLARKAAAVYPVQSAQLLAAVQAAVVYKVVSKAKPDGTGLSVFFPFRDRYPDLDTYRTVPFSPAYRNFAVDWSAALFADDEPVQFVDSRTAVQSSDGGRSVYSVTVQPGDADEIAEAYSVVARVEPVTGRILFLGMDNDVFYDEQTGELSDGFDGATVTLDGHFVSLFFEDEAEASATYSIPVKLNGTPVDLSVLYDFATDTADVLGAWPGFNPQTGMAARELLPVKAGDRVTPRFFYFDPATDKDGYADGAEFTVGQGGLSLGLADLPPGEYLHGFYVVDLAGNEAYTEFTPLVIGAVPAAVRVYVGGRRLVFDVPPAIRSGRTLVPLRTIFEALGATVSWDGETRTVTAVKGGVTISLQIDNPVALRNGVAITLDQAPVIVGGRTLVPVRFVSEALGATVAWDGETQTIHITP